MRNLLTSSVLCLTALCLTAKEPVPQPSAEAGTLPPARYVIDYYSPPQDWVPARGIGQYTLNIRIPDLFWLKYDNAYTMALRIRPVTQEQIQKNINVNLIAPKDAEKALTFSPELEKNTGYRTVQITGLKVPADDAVEFSFKMKSTKANPEVIVSSSGIGTINTLKNEDKETSCLDGFKSYRIKVQPRKNGFITGFSIQVPESGKYDPAEEYVFIDFHVKRNAPRPRFTDLPQRQWIRKEAFFNRKEPLTVKDGIADVNAFLETKPAGIKVLDLPIAGHQLRPQTDKEKDGGFKVETVKETLNGQTVDALRITLTKGPRCYLKFPVEFDATEYNTMTMYAKIDLPEGLPPFKMFGDTYSEIYGNNCHNMNSFFDVFSAGVHSREWDHAEWNKHGVSQIHSMHNKQKDAKVSGGWFAIAQDLRYGDMPNNKTTTLNKISHWIFYYANAKIPEGKQIVVTIAKPRVASGLMQAGGMMGKYREFLADKEKNRLTDYSDSKKYLGTPETNRLSSPLPFIVNHIPHGEFVFPKKWGQGYRSCYRQIPLRAVDYFQKLLQNKYGLTHPVPVLDTPSKADNVKIFLGGSEYSKVNPEQFKKDQEALKGTSGFAIRSHGKNIYIYGGNFNYAGEMRGVANGLYQFIEYNTDDIMAITTKDGVRQVFDISKDGNMNLVWGNGYVNIPAANYVHIARSRPEYLDRNMSWMEDSWNLQETYGGEVNTGTGHWLAHIGSDYREENDKWGKDEYGKRIKPGCYTRHCCMINVLEDAKTEYLNNSALRKQDSIYYPKEESYVFRYSGRLGFWLEDNDRYCQCEKCRTPIRLPDGSLLPSNDPEFRGTQYYLNGTAMIQHVNVFARRDMKIEAIGYFWMTNPPAVEISRNFFIRFCPYFRKNYFEPIYAPCNDNFWRAMYRWSQVDVEQGLYDYFLNVNFRPWGTIAKYDVKAEADIGIRLLSHEGSSNGAIDMLERWVTLRVIRDPSADVQQLRKYFIRRTFREAAPEMEKFYFTMTNFIQDEFAPNHLMELEDLAWIGVHAFKKPSKVKKGLSVMEEADFYFREAQKKAKNPMTQLVLEDFRKAWEFYYNEAKGFADKL